MKPAWWRIIAAAGVLAWFSWLIEVAFGRWNPILFGVLSGATLGIFGARWTKVALGIVTGGLVGWAVGGWLDDPHLPVIGALVVLVYRSSALGLFRGQPLTEVKGEAVDPSSMPFLVPYAAAGPSVGAAYLRDLADSENWGFERNPEGGGIVGAFDELAGPDFRSAEVDPLIREFYEHTTRFKLDIVPEWRWWMLGPYWVFRRLVSLKVDQVNVPYSQREAQRGMVSYVDVATAPGRDPIRAWIRVFEDTGAPIYVGIYTTIRQENRGYVAVGFPLPDSNITVALSPSNLVDGGLLLSSKADHVFCGHYLSAIEPSKGATTLRLGLFDEEIEVYLKNGDLETDHRFYLGRIRFLTLHYSMHRK